MKYLENEWNTYKMDVEIFSEILAFKVIVPDLLMLRGYHNAYS